MRDGRAESLLNIEDKRSDGAVLAAHEVGHCDHAVNAAAAQPKLSAERQHGRVPTQAIHAASA